MVTDTLNIHVTTLGDWHIFGAVCTFTRKILNLTFQSLISKETYMYNSGHSGGGVRSKTLFTQGEPFSIMTGVMIGI